MKNLQDFLILDTRRYGGSKCIDETKYVTEIKCIDKNPFYLPFGDKPTHWELTINVFGRYTNEDEPEEFECITDSPLKFKMSAYSLQPTMEQFSEHMRTECLAVIDALEGDLSKMHVWDLEQKVFVNFDEIEPKHVYKFLKNIHKDYTKTEDFLKDFNHYHNRIYHCCKFMHNIIAGNSCMFKMSWDYPIGEHFLAFLTDDAKFFDYYETI